MEKNPYVFLTPVFKDYEKHLKELDTKYSSSNTTKEIREISTETTKEATKPLLGAVFGSNSKPAEPVTFGSSSGFAFGSEKTVSTTENKSNSGFKFGTSTNDEAIKKDNSTADSSGIFTQKSEDNNKPTGFSFGSNENSKSNEKTVETPKTVTTGFSFGSSSNDKPSSGFTFGSTESEKENSSKNSGFTFGKKSEESKPSTGFSFGSTAAKTDTKAFSFGTSENNSGETKSGFTFGSGGTTFGSVGATFGSITPATTTTESKNDEAEAEDEPPKVEVNQVVEDDAFHSVR